MNSDETQKDQEAKLRQEHEIIADQIASKEGWSVSTDKNDIAAVLYTPEYQRVLREHKGNYGETVAYFYKKYGNEAKSILLAIASAKIEERK